MTINWCKDTLRTWRLALVGKLCGRGRYSARSPAASLARILAASIARRGGHGFAVGDRFAVGSMIAPSSASGILLAFLAPFFGSQIASARFCCPTGSRRGGEPVGS